MKLPFKNKKPSFKCLPNYSPKKQITRTINLKSKNNEKTITIIYYCYNNLKL